jgi:hypothetical protein
MEIMMPPRNLLTGHFREYSVSLLLFMLMFGIGWFYGYLYTFEVRPVGKTPNFTMRTKELFQYPHPDIVGIEQEMGTAYTPNSNYPGTLSLAKFEYYGSMFLFILAFINTFLPYQKKYIVQIVLVLTAILALWNFTYIYANYISDQLDTPIRVSVIANGYWYLIGYSFASICYCISSIVTHADKKYSLQGKDTY